jgi:hypothetical protein
MVARKHPVVSRITINKHVLRLPVSAISPRARKRWSNTHHPPPLRPNTKSMHASSFLRLSNPVNVAHSPPTCRRGAATRTSRMTSCGSAESPRGGSGKRRANSSGTGGGFCAPVRTAYAPSSSPFAELSLALVERTGGMTRRARTC